MLRLILILLGILLATCSSDEQPGNYTTSSGNAAGDYKLVLDPSFDLAIRNILLSYLAQIDTDFDDLTSELDNLEESVEAFLRDPQANTMNRMRDRWLSAHFSYELTTLHLQFAEQILLEQDTLALFQLQYQMNHWPILPGYVDYVQGYADSGIVNDINVSLDMLSLKEQHGAFDLAEASLGFHVLEFLMWGENKDRQSERPPSDYFVATQLNSVAIETDIELGQRNESRRRRILSLIMESLVNDFNTSRTIWSATSDRFRAGLSDLNSNDIVILLLDATTTILTEEILLRSLYPLLNGEYVDSIQSPFSHSTQNVVSAQLSSVERLLRETFGSSGERLDSVLVYLSRDFEEFFYQNFDASKECLILLYSKFEVPESAMVKAEAEFEIVECINLLTNTIDYLEQIKIDLSRPV